MMAQLQWKKSNNNNNGADVNEKTECGRTPVYIERQHKNIADLFRNHFCKMNAEFKAAQKMNDTLVAWD